MAKKKLSTQPRIPGVRRLFTGGGLHPEVRKAFVAIAFREGRSLSWVIAEIVSDATGVDCVTGEKRRKRA